MRLPALRSFVLPTIAILASTLCVDAAAHHSFARFDSSRIVEVEGELLSFSWRNPHIRFEILAINDKGDEVRWALESHSVSILRRTNASPEGLKKGDRIRIAGWLTVRPSTEIFVHNLMLPNGREIVFGAEARPRWSTGNVVGDETEWLTAGTASDDRGRDGLYRVWSTYFGPGSTFRTFWKREYPFTEAGQRRKDAWDPLTDTSTPGCEPKGMPLIMEQPYPMEFTQGDGVIEIHLEEYDTVRAIHMDLAAAPLDPERSLLGFSTGRWEDDTLVVATVAVDFAHFDPNGTPQGSDPGFVERFRVSDDGSRLLYELTATDNEIFTEPVTVTRDWVWRPGEQVRPYECRQ